MDYIKQNFKSRQVLTAASLNAMDSQISENAQDIENVKTDVTGLKEDLGMNFKVLINGIKTWAEDTFAQKSDIPKTDGLLSEVLADNKYQPKGDYLTEHQNLDGYAKLEDIPALENHDILSTITADKIAKWDAKKDGDIIILLSGDDLIDVQESEDGSIDYSFSSEEGTNRFSEIHHLLENGASNIYISFMGQITIPLTYNGDDSMYGFYILPTEDGYSLEVKWHYYAPWRVSDIRFRLEFSLYNPPAMRINEMSYDGNNNVDFTPEIQEMINVAFYSSDYGNYINSLIDELIAEATPTDYDTLKKTVAENERQIDFLKKVSKGQLWDIEQREEEGHAQLPSGGMYGYVDEVRGKTEQDSTNGINILPPTSKSGDFHRVKIPNGTRFYWATDGTPSTGGNFKTLNEDKTRSQLIAVNAGTTKASFTATFDVSYVQDLLEGDLEKSKMCFAVSPTEFTYEPYTGGIPSPNPEFPQEIKSVDEIYIRHTDADDNLIEERTITPPRPLNAIGEYKDKCDVVNGVWEYVNEDMLFNSTSWSRKITGSTVYFSGGIKTPLGNYAQTYCENYIPTTWTSKAKGIYVQVSGSAIVLDTLATVSEFLSLNGNARLVYPLAEPTAEPISESDLTFLRNLELKEGENLYITDNWGRDVSYLMSDYINLAKAVE